MPLDHWPTLLPFLQQTCTSPQAAHREVGIYILYTVLENIVEGFENHMKELFTLFAALLNDPESLEVRITTVRYVNLPEHEHGTETTAARSASSHNTLIKMIRMKLYVNYLDAYDSSGTG